MKKVIRWIVLVWSVVGAIDVLTDVGYAWDATLYALVFSGLVIGLMVSDLKK